MKKFELDLSGNSRGKVLIDGHNIADYVYAVFIEAIVDSPPRITIKLTQGIHVKIVDGHVILEYPKEGHKFFKGRSRNVESERFVQSDSSDTDSNDGESS